MDTTQIILVTILCVCEFIVLFSFLFRVSNLEDQLWVEPVIMLVLALFIYLVAR